MTETLRLKVASKQYQELGDIDLRITPALKSKLEKTKTQRGSLLNTVETVGFKGGKHLLEALIDNIGKNVVVILTQEESRIDGNKIYIDFDKYSKAARNKFMGIYRKTGVSAARDFLQRELKITPKGPKEILTRNEVEALVVNFPEYEKLVSSNLKGELLSHMVALVQQKKIDLSGLTAEDLKEFRASISQAFFKRKLTEFRKRLNETHSETTGDDSWQKWVYANNWLFGSNYLDPLPKEKIGFDSLPDFLFQTIEGFLDVLEIKLPSADIILSDSSHPGSYYFSAECSKAIGQVINYLSEMELHQLELAKRLDISVVKPRGIILIGKTAGWSEQKMEAFRKLNLSLHNIEILSYDQLMMRGNRLVEIYDQNARPRQ